MGYYTEILGLPVHVNIGSGFYPAEKEFTMLKSIVKNKKETLGKPEMCAAIAEKTGVPLKAVSKVWDAYHSTIMGAISENHKVVIRGFGTFSSRYSPEHYGRNPQTEEEIVITEKVVPTLRFGAVFKRSVAAGFKKIKDTL